MKAADVPAPLGAVKKNSAHVLEIHLNVFLCREATEAGDSREKGESFNQARRVETVQGLLAECQ